jgi:simple sugar transport system substrate-binding protein
MTRRFTALLIGALLAAALAACGEKEVVREQAVTVGQGTQGADRRATGRTDDAVRIAVVTHGQASSPFWAIVRNGVEAAGRQMDAVTSYRAPDVYSLEKMKDLVAQAVASKPDGIVVSFPEPRLAGAVRRAVRSGIPVVTINSGSDVTLKLGVLAHVGQPEDRAGLESGRRLARGGVRRALCVNQQIGNVGLDERCAGLARAMRAVGGTSRVLGVDDQSPATVGRIERAIDAGRIDGVLALNSTTATQVLQARGRARRGAGVAVASFDLGTDVLRAVQRRRLLFAVDQQAYLQGYLPVVLLTQRVRYGLFPAQGDVIPTGPNFVTSANAGKAIALAARSIR